MARIQQKKQGDESTTTAVETEAAINSLLQYQSLDVDMECNGDYTQQSLLQQHANTTPVSYTTNDYNLSTSGSGNNLTSDSSTKASSSYASNINAAKASSTQYHLAFPTATDASIGDSTLHFNPSANNTHLMATGMCNNTLGINSTCNGMGMNSTNTLRTKDSNGSTVLLKPPPSPIPQNSPPITIPNFSQQDVLQAQQPYVIYSSIPPQSREIIKMINEKLVELKVLFEALGSL